MKRQTMAILALMFCVLGGVAVLEQEGQAAVALFSLAFLLAYLKDKKDT